MLVVDDHQLFTHALTTVLEQDGRFAVVGTAATGREAVTLAKRAEADVVLMDMSMPVLDGPAATRRLVALEHAPKVIALSGHSDKLSRAAALDSGAAAFVTKSEGVRRPRPDDPRDLRTGLSRASAGEHAGRG